MGFCSGFRIEVTPHEGSFTLTLSVADVSVFDKEHAYDVFLRHPEGMLCIIQGKIFLPIPSDMVSYL